MAFAGRVATMQPQALSVGAPGAQRPSAAGARVACAARSAGSAALSTSRRAIRERSPSIWCSGDSRGRSVTPTARAYGQRSQLNPSDPFSLLQSQRIVFLAGEVNDVSADAVINQLMLLDSEDSLRPIKLFINSPGGSVTAGMGIYDTMTLCQAPVETYCIGLAASMGAFLLGAGTKGRRYALPNARIMIHQPLGGFGGRAAEVEVQTNEIMFHKANLNRIMAAYTGQPIERIEKDTERDFYMSPREAVVYGLIDRVIGGGDAGEKIRSQKAAGEGKDDAATGGAGEAKDRDGGQEELEESGEGAAE